MLLRQDAHQTEFKMSCVAVQQTAVNPGGWGGIISDHLSRVWLVHWGKCFSCLPVYPPARQSPSPVVVAREVENVWANNPLWSVRWQTADDLSLERDINLISPPSKKTGSFWLFFFFFTSVSPSRTKPRLCYLPKHFPALIHVQGSVLPLWQSLSLKPVTSDPSPQLTLLQRVSRGSSWRAAALRHMGISRCWLSVQPGSVNTRPLAEHFWNWSFNVTREAFFVFFPCRTWTWFPCRLTGNGRWRLHSLRAVLITPWPWNELWIALIFSSYCKHIDMQGLCVWVDVPAKST